MSVGEYEVRVAQQIQQFGDLEALWRLPPITQYWMGRHIAPRVEQVFGKRSVFDIYADYVSRACARCREAHSDAVVFSIGSGDCSVEIALARRLLSTGVTNFQLVATELSPQRLERARGAAAAAGVAANFEFRVTDLNEVRLDSVVDVFIAHHTLHHIVNLEGLFEEVRRSMHSDSVFLSADMIGRNGHRRWPETLEWISRLWAFIPSHYKFNYQFNASHAEYLDWDCSRTGFEGIRAQDILPLLVDRFHFEGFLGYGGIIDPFIERGYGRNLDEDRAEDRGFIDFVEHLNQTLIEAGRIKPTMMIAAMRSEPCAERSFGHLTPRFAVRIVTEGQ